MNLIRVIGMMDAESEITKQSNRILAMTSMKVSRCIVAKT